MAKRGRYSNKTKAQANTFIELMGGSVDAAHDMAFARSEMFWEDVNDGEREEIDAKEATTLTNYLGFLSRKRRTESNT